jgi:hypothetical protein
LQGTLGLMVQISFRTQLRSDRFVSAHAAFPELGGDAVMSDRLLMAHRRLVYGIAPPAPLPLVPGARPSFFSDSAARAGYTREQSHWR